jgi:formylglycine-generating enzyme required for sulfatase activity
MTKVFISYRRSASKHLARLIFHALIQQGHDVFLDVTTIDSGAFDRIILNQIKAREHFLLILSKGSLERCQEEGDWLYREIEEAFRLKRNIIPIFDEEFSIEIERQYLQEPMQTRLFNLNGPQYSHIYFEAFIDSLSKRFLKLPEYEIVVSPTPKNEENEVKRRIKLASIETNVNTSDRTDAISQGDIVSSINSLIYLRPLPEPFNWVEIPDGKVVIVPELNSIRHETKNKILTIKSFSISKYPITNLQFQAFIDAGGYDEREYWIEQGWVYREEKNWSKPVDWRKNVKSDHPVTGLSWFEAKAFCKWLSKITKQKIELPTEEQWQRAAQGDSKQKYPWGNLFIKTYCNYSPYRRMSNDKSSTTPVQKYDEKYAKSSFGVADMIGNVWEWCSTVTTTVATRYESYSSSNVNIKNYIVRGGAWDTRSEDELSVTHRESRNSIDRSKNLGFRIVRN